MRFNFFVSIRQIIHNKKKSIPLFLCIFITLVMLISLLGMYESYQQMVYEDIVESYGGYHFYINDAETSEEEFLRNNAYVEKIGHETAVDSVSLMSFNGECIDTEQILELKMMDETGYELNTLRLKSGRFPEKEGEITVSAGLELMEGYAYTEAENGGSIEVTLSDGKTELYTVVGVLDNFNAGQYDNVYDALVKCDVSGKKSSTYVLLNCEDIKKTVDDIASELGYSDEAVYKQGNRIVDLKELVKDYEMVCNSPYISYEADDAYSENDKSISYITLILALFVVIIAFMLIWNMYTVMSEQRSKEYGLLRICGVTVKKMVFISMTEGLILYLAALVPGILFLGLERYFTQRAVQALRINALSDISISISAVAVIIGAVVVGFIVMGVTFFTTLLMLKKASPVELVNGTKKAAFRKKRR